MGKTPGKKSKEAFRNGEKEGNAKPDNKKEKGSSEDKLKGIQALAKKYGIDCDDENKQGTSEDKIDTAKKVQTRTRSQKYGLSNCEGGAEQQKEVFGENEPAAPDDKANKVQKYELSGNEGEDQQGIFGENEQAPSDAKAEEVQKNELSSYKGEGMEQQGVLGENEQAPSDDKAKEAQKNELSGYKAEDMQQQGVFGKNEQAPSDDKAEEVQKNKLSGYEGEDKQGIFGETEQVASDKAEEVQKNELSGGYEGEDKQGIIIKNEQQGASFEGQENDLPDQEDQQFKRPTTTKEQGGKRRVRKKRTIERCHIYKRYTDGAFTIKNLHPLTGKTTSFYYNNARRAVLFTNNIEKFWFYHSLKTGTRVQTTFDGKRTVTKFEQL